MATETVRAKFKCTSVTNYESSKGIELSAVISGSEENKSFSKYTPSGHLRIGIDNDAPASNFFTPGKEYYIDFQEAE